MICDPTLKIDPDGHDGHYVLTEMAYLRPRSTDRKYSEHSENPKSDEFMGIRDPRTCGGSGSGKPSGVALVFVDF